MNLERRTFLAVFVTLVAATGLAFAVAQAVAFQSVQGLEEEQASENLLRATQAIRDEIAALNRTAQDWAHGDDAYAFMLGLNPDFADSNFAVGAFKAQQVNVVLFFNRTDNLVYGTGFDLRHNSFTPVPGPWLSAPVLDLILPHPDATGSTSGILLVGSRPVMVASLSILNSASQGPAMGTLVWGRDLDEDAVAALRAHTILDLSLTPWPQAASEPGLEPLAASEGVTVIAPRSSSLIAASTRLDDIAGRPAVVLEVRMDRPIYEQSVQNLAFGLASTILVGGGLLVLITMMLDRSVFSPLHRLTRDVEGLGAGATGGRVSALRDDEIGHLALSFNRLMARIDRHKLDIERSNQDLRDFAAVVSHDLQPPLSTIALNAAVVRERERTRLEPDAMQRLDRLETTALRMAEHIRSILDYSRAASQDAPMMHVNLNAVMDDVISDLEERLHATGGRIEYRSLPGLHGNRTQLVQLLLNLMGNALKFHREGFPPVVKVHAEPYSDGKGWQGWRIVVEDNGIGFNAAELDKMVRPYTRLGHGVEGYGLGLATCHKIVQRHQGRLSAHSVPGAGSTFMVDLPAKQSVEDSNIPAAPSAS